MTRRLASLAACGCVGASCCAPLDACTADSACGACLVGDPSATDCDALLADVATCFADSCGSVCDG